MTTRIDLPDGGWADLRDPETVTERQRRPVTRSSGIVFAVVERAKATLDMTAFAGLPQAEADKALAAAAAAAAGADPAGIEAMETLNDALVAALVEAWSFEAAPSADALLDLPGPAYDALRTACAPLMGALMPDFGVSPDPASPTSPSAA